MGNGTNFLVAILLNGLFFGTSYGLQCPFVVQYDNLNPDPTMDEDFFNEKLMHVNSTGVECEAHGELELTCGQVILPWRKGGITRVIIMACVAGQSHAMKNGCYELTWKELMNNVTIQNLDVIGQEILDWMDLHNEPVSACFHSQLKGTPNSWNLWAWGVTIITILFVSFLLRLFV